MVIWTLATASYYAAGLLYAVACIPAFRRDAAWGRRHGRRASIPLAMAKTLFLWPRYLFARGQARDKNPQASIVPLVTFHKPDYDRIAELEHENGLDQVP